MFPEDHKGLQFKHGAVEVAQICRSESWLHPDVLTCRYLVGISIHVCKPLEVYCGTVWRQKYQVLNRLFLPLMGCESISCACYKCMGWGKCHILVYIHANSLGLKLLLCELLMECGFVALGEIEGMWFCGIKRN